MYALVLIRYRAPIEEIVMATEDHRAWLRSLHARELLLASGPFDPRSGGALLFRLPDDGSVTLDSLRDGDPFWRLGLANYELLHWNPTIGVEGLNSL